MLDKAMLDKVRCRSCRNEDGGVCSLKGVGVKLNKRRRCSHYRFELSKINTRPYPKTIRVKMADVLEQKRIRAMERKMKEMPIEVRVKMADVLQQRRLELLKKNDYMRYLREKEKFERSVAAQQNDVKTLTDDLSEFKTTGE